MTPSNNRKHRAQQKTRPQGSNPGTLTKRTVHDNFMVLEFYARTKIPTKVRSCYRVSITSNQAAKKNLLEVKTITKSPGLLSLSKLAMYIKKAVLKLNK